MKEQTAALEEKIQALEERLATLESANKSDAQKATEDREAQALLRAAQAHIAAGRSEDAKKELKKLIATYPKAKVVRYAQQTMREVELIGKDAGELDVEKWFEGKASMDEGKLTLLVFWESWCPHCKREVPKLEALYQKHKADGLNVIGLTKVTRSSTDEKVEAFISEHELSYPVAKEKDGVMSKRFAVSGVPAAALVKNGKVVWRGHPSKLNDGFVKGWIDKPAS
jgi:thiol-disulfide isomerase/thioredoxin